jgi:hypothetical protein
MLTWDGNKELFLMRCGPKTEVEESATSAFTMKNYCYQNPIAPKKLVIHLETIRKLLKRIKTDIC